MVVEVLLFATDSVGQLSVLASNQVIVSRTLSHGARNVPPTHSSVHIIPLIY